MIAEAIDTVVSIGWAIVAWIIAGAFVATVIVIGGLATGTWAVRGLWRAVTRRQTGAYGAESGPCDSPDANTPQTPARRRTPPSWARTEHDHQEAA